MLCSRNSSRTLWGPRPEILVVRLQAPLLDVARDLSGHPVAAGRIVERVLHSQRVFIHNDCSWNAKLVTPMRAPILGGAGMAMYLSGQQKAGLNSAAVNRAYMAKTGLTYAGQKIWTFDEIVVLRSWYPDYQSLLRLLPERTARAISNKAGKLGLARSRFIWSEPEFATMKPLYLRGMPMREILPWLDNKTAKQVWKKAWNRGVRRPRRPPRLTGFAVLDAVRRRAFELNFSMKDLDTITGRNSYFRCPRHVDWKAVQQVLPYLGGSATVVWRLD